MPEVLLGLLVRRIDEGERAPLGRRQEGPQAREAVATLDPHAVRAVAAGLREAPEGALERVRFRSQELDEHRTILPPQLTRRDPRRARIQMPLCGAGAELCQQRRILAQ